MGSKNKGECRLAWGLKIFLGQGQMPRKVWPAIPGPGRHHPEVVRGPPHWPAATIVIAILGHIEAPIRRERQAKRVAKTPGDQFEPSRSEERRVGKECRSRWS